MLPSAMPVTKNLISSGLSSCLSRFLMMMLTACICCPASNKRTSLANQAQGSSRTELQLLVQQRRHARELDALQHLERSPSTSGDMCDLIRQPRFLESGHGLAAAH